MKDEIPGEEKEEPKINMVGSRREDECPRTPEFHLSATEGKAPPTQPCVETEQKGYTERFSRKGGYCPALCLSS